MKKEELMKQYEELKGKGKEPEMIFLYIHMPTGETETIVNPNVEEKMKYIDRTYNEDLVHANCKDIYIEQAYICADFGPTMMFSDAYMLMKQGAKVKLPNWGRLLVLGCREENNHDAHQRRRGTGYPPDGTPRIHL